MTFFLSPINAIENFKGDFRAGHADRQMENGREENHVSCGWKETLHDMMKESSEVSGGILARLDDPLGLEVKTIKVFHGGSIFQHLRHLDSC